MSLNVQGKNLMEVTYEYKCKRYNSWFASGFSKPGKRNGFKAGQTGNILAPDNLTHTDAPETLACHWTVIDEAIEYYRTAVKYDPDNGNRYYDLGFALASAERFSDALKNLAKAEELGCTPENLVQLYNLLGILCFDIGRYDDALVNLNKAEKLIGIDVDILKRKAVIYGIKKRY